MRDLLGFKVKDIVTGFVGIAVTETTSIGETTKYFVEPPVGEDNDLRQGDYFPEGRLKVIEEIKSLDDKLNDILNDTDQSRFPI
jgi:hypothetical protein